MTVHYLWLDFETTGLDPAEHSIIEVAAICTDADLAVLGQYTSLVKPRWNSWSTQAARMHFDTGLFSEIQDPPTPMLRLDIVEGQVLNLLSGKGRAILAGNSVHFDRSFIRVHMPELDGRLSHRHFDVSVLRDLAPVWWPELQLPPKQKSHRALADIEYALDLARFFRRSLQCA